MNHLDHVALLREGIPTPGGVWADIGSGRGAFTLALAELLGPEGDIHSVDRDGGALRAQASALGARFPQTHVQFRTADFTRKLDLPPLDGLVMANALHFVQNKEPVVSLLARSLRPGGRLILVEYDTGRGNQWVPYPLTYPDWQTLASRCGLVETRLLATRPSSFLGGFFSALSFTGPAESYLPDGAN
jgi:ubiquinone/menaquinone biosynthesis C-methylase UbiE